MIVVSDDYAFNILEKYYNDFFPQVPVVFCGTNAFDANRLAGKENFVGIDERPSFKETIDLIFRLRPQTKHIVVIHDDSITGQINSKTFRSEASVFNEQADFEYLAGLPLETLVERMQKLSSDTAAFYFASFVKTIDGKHYSSGEALEIISAKSPVPIFGGWEFSLNHGIIGGKLINLVEHGSLAGRIAVEIFKGKSPTSMAGLFPSPNSFMFDDNELRRFQIEDSLLPTGSTIINRPQTFYQKNRAEIFITLSTLLAMAVIGAFIALFNSRSRLQQTYHEQLETEKNLRESRTELKRAKDLSETILNTIEDAVCLINTEDYSIVGANKTFLAEYKTTPKDILGSLCYDITHHRQEPCCLTDAKCPLKETVLEGRTSHAEHRHVLPDESEIFVDIITSPVMDEKGKVIQVVHIARNITDRKKAEKEKEKLVMELQTAIEEIKTLKGIIPICMHCKGIRDDKGSWHKLEKFIMEHSEAQFSHGICEECLKKYYPEEAD
jgi:PAS domain-containing protein